MYNLQNLSEQLDPLESAYADVRFFDVGVEQIQQQYDVCKFLFEKLLSIRFFKDLLSAMAAEVRDEEQMNDAIRHLLGEIEQLEETMRVKGDTDSLVNVSVH
jgi:hypothetical protein